MRKTWIFVLPRSSTRSKKLQWHTRSAASFRDRSAGGGGITRVLLSHVLGVSYSDTQHGSACHSVLEQDCRKHSDDVPLRKVLAAGAGRNARGSSIRRDGAADDIS